MQRDLAALTGPEGASLEYMQRYARQLEAIATTLTDAAGVHWTIALNPATGELDASGPGEDSDHGVDGLDAVDSRPLTTRPA